MRVVVKIGSQVLTLADSGIDEKIITSLAGEIDKLIREREHEFVIVTSGAVSIGRSTAVLKDFKVAKWPGLNYSKEILKNQIRAGYGQSELMFAYKQAFRKHSLDCAQVLATTNDFASRRRYLSMRTVTENYIQLGIIPIFNENDVLSAEELGPTFNDNDHLATMVGAMIDAQKLVLLSSVDGFYRSDSITGAPEVVPVIAEIAPYLENIDDTTSEGKGGMLSKLLAANQAQLLGMDVHIASGKQPETLTAILAGESVGTRIPAAEVKPKAAKRWVATAPMAEGKIIVSTSLADLLRKRRSASILFPGIERVDGDFTRDQVVGVYDDGQTYLGKGQSIYGASQLRQKVAECERSYQEGSADATLAAPIAIHYNYFVFSEADDGARNA